MLLLLLMLLLSSETIVRMDTGAGVVAGDVVSADVHAGTVIDAVVEEVMGGEEILLSGLAGELKLGNSVRCCSVEMWSCWLWSCSLLLSSSGVSVSPSSLALTKDIKSHKRAESVPSGRLYGF